MKRIARPGVAALILIALFVWQGGLGSRSGEGESGARAPEASRSGRGDSVAGADATGRGGSPSRGLSTSRAFADALPSVEAHLGREVGSDAPRDPALDRLSASPRASRRPRASPSVARIEILEKTPLLARTGPDFSMGGPDAWSHTPYQLEKHGLPILNRRGRIHHHGGRVRGVAGAVRFPPIRRGGFALDRDAAIAAARRETGVLALRAPIRTEQGYYAAAGETLPVWRIQLASREPLAAWQVTLDAQTGEILSKVDRILFAEGAGLVYHPNVREARGPSSVPLRELDGTGRLAGTITRVLDERDVEAYEPDLDFSFPTDDPRFVQTAVYRGLTQTGLLAVENGFPAFSSPIVAFTNLDDANGDEYNNAFYDPTLPAFGFGNGDGVVLSNLGTDLDVAAHEMGHHIFETLVTPEIETFFDPVLAMHEGVADTFSFLIGGDLEIGESTVPDEKFLRTLKGKIRFPDALDTDPHETGRVYGAVNADLKKALKDAFLPTFFAALPLIPPDAVEVEYRDAFLQADANLNAGAFASKIRKAFKKRGFDEVEDPPEFQGRIRVEEPETGTLGDGEFHYYFFAEFPDSTTVDFATTGTGDVDLLVAPIETFDPENPLTYRYSGTSGPAESVTIGVGTAPSVDDSDSWVVFVIDFEDGQSSDYEVEAGQTLPAAQIEIDGPPVSSNIVSAADVDWFLFEGVAGEIVRLEVRELTPGLDPVSAIAKVDGFEILAADDDAGPGADVLIQGVRLPETTSYAVGVISAIADLDPTVGVGDYEITLSLCGNVGTDTDLDLLADVCDDDDDGDGYKDAHDSGPLDPLLCSDVDRDGCDDCASGASDFLDDGPDDDLDGFCDVGDTDDDNDGCVDVDDPAPFSTSVDPDFDFLGADCDNCPDVPNPAQIDSDLDGQGDACSICSIVSWTDPPGDPLDQNPARSRVTLKGLDKEFASLKLGGEFGLPFAAMSIDPSSSGVFLRLADGAGRVFAVNLPPGAPGSSLCGPKDGWTVKTRSDRTTFTYKNQSGAVPGELCDIGSAGGRVALQIESTPVGIEYKASFSAVGLEREVVSPVGFLQLDLVLGNQETVGVAGAAGAAGLCAESILRVADSTTRCKISEKRGVLKSIDCSKE